MGPAVLGQAVQALVRRRAQLEGAALWNIQPVRREIRTRSNFWVPVMTRAAVFGTRCSLSVVR